MNIDGYTFELRYVRCGKAPCFNCDFGYGHGPYWYAYKRVNGRVKSYYVGKREPASWEAIPADQPEPTVDPRWVFKGRMDGRSALRILGFTSWPEQAVLRKRWAALVSQHHPDRGGNTKICAAINVAYEYLKK